MGIARQLGGTSPGSNSAPLLLSDPNKTLPLSGPGSLFGEEVRLESSLPPTKNPGPHSPGALQQGRPLKNHVHGD